MTRRACIPVLALVLLTVSIPGAVRAADEGRPGFTVAEVSRTEEKVKDIDYGTRKVTLLDAKGKVRTITVGESVSNLNRVKIGDEVTIEVHTDIAVEVQRGEGERMNIGSESQTSPMPGAKPSGVRTIEGKLKTRVESIDYDARTIAFKNRKGVLTKYKIGPQAKRFNEIRRGDMLIVDYSQITTLEVK